MPFETDNLRYEDVKNDIGATLAGMLDGLLSKSMKAQSPIGRATAKNGGLADMINVFMDKPVHEVCESDCFSLRVVSFKPSTQETPTGSDLAMVFEVFEGNASLPRKSKTTLIQAKSAEIEIGASGVEEVFFNNAQIKSQLETILAISPRDGFLLLYTDAGSYSLDADIALTYITGKTAFRCPRSILKSGGSVASDLAICRRGNEPSISPLRLGVRREADHSVNLDDLAEKLKTHGLKKKPVILKMTAKIKPAPKSTLVKKLPKPRKPGGRI